MQLLEKTIPRTPAMRHRSSRSDRARPPRSGSPTRNARHVNACGTTASRPREDGDRRARCLVVVGFGRPGLRDVAGRRAPAGGAGACRDEPDLRGELDRLGLRAALDRERGDGADRDERRADHDCGVHALDELLAGAVAALPTSTAARTAPAKTPPSSGFALLAPEASPSSSGRTDDSVMLDHPGGALPVDIGGK